MNDVNFVISVPSVNSYRIHRIIHLNIWYKHYISHYHGMQGAVGEGRGFAHLGTVIFNTWPSREVKLGSGRWAYSQILAGARCFQHLSMLRVDARQWIIYAYGAGSGWHCITWAETHVPGIFPYMLPVGLPVAEPDLGGFLLSWREIGIFKHMRWIGDTFTFILYKAA